MMLENRRALSVTDGTWAVLVGNLARRRTQENAGERRRTQENA
jgi:hypothetical protein